jgi:hypothetical protein
MTSTLPSALAQPNGRGGQRFNPGDPHNPVDRVGIILIGDLIDVLG